MKLSLRLTAIAATATALLLGATSHGHAQDAAVKQMYESSHGIPTNIPGITTFAAPPAGFDATHATDAQLARYGLPPRPDPRVDPLAYARWSKAMRQPVRRLNNPLIDMHASSMNLQPAGARSAGVNGAPSTYATYNWSGIANTVPGLTAWSSVKSFYFVISEFNVPRAQEPFGACDGETDWEVSWNGIDGFSNGDVLQGGSSSSARCSGGTTTTSYCAWIEWYPSYPILCQYGVNPGDDMYVETWDTSSTNGYVYLEDMTQNFAASYNLQPTEGPYLVGNSAEYIVERPCCENGNYYPLANYVMDFWADSYAYIFATYNAGNPTKQVAGSQAPSTYVVSMVNDQDSQVISSPVTGGKYDITFQSSGCAYSGGCTP